MHRRVFIKGVGTLVVGTMGAVSFISCDAKRPFPFKKGQVIGFFGDSITYAGGYIEQIRNVLSKDFPEYKLKLINFGLNSETITGLSEERHPNPRPWLFDRFERTLNDNLVDVAFFCYGINCGIYHPFSDTTLQKYKDGIQRFLRVVEERNMTCVLMTPPPIALSEDKKKELIENDDNDYSWMTPYAHYGEEVLHRFRDTVLAIDHPSVIGKIDLYEPLSKHIDTSYGEDPIHPNTAGHKVIADAILKELGISSA